MNDLQRRILTVAQGDLPLEADPFQAWACEVGVPAGDLVRELRFLKTSGAVRRFGGVFDSRAMGWTTTLVGARVAREDLEPLLEWIASLTGTTHVYVRDHWINVWFTLAVPRETDRARLLDVLRRYEGVLGIWSMPRKQQFKLELRFPLEDRAGTGVAEGPTPGMSSRASTSRLVAGGFSELEKGIVRELQGDMEPRPDLFEGLAGRLGVPLDALLESARGLKESGRLKRIGAVVRHRLIGIEFNAMVAARVPEDRIEELGRRVASRPYVSHCFEREVPPEFPCNLFVMVHGRDEEEGEAILEELRRELGPEEMQVLRSVREVKKESMKYF